MNLAGRVQMFVFLRIFSLSNILGGSSIYSLKGKNNNEIMTTTIITTIRIINNNNPQKNNK